MPSGLRTCLAYGFPVLLLGSGTVGLGLVTQLALRRSPPAAAAPRPAAEALRLRWDGADGALSAAARSAVEAWVARIPRGPGLWIRVQSDRAPQAEAVASALRRDGLPEPIVEVTPAAAGAVVVTTGRR
jgi:hypothetical protein